MRYDSQTMKSATLASLLVTSAAAGAAAAGGPFFFATTCPMSVSIGPTVVTSQPAPVNFGSLTTNASQVVTEDFVVTDINVNDAAKLGIAVDGVMVWQSKASTNVLSTWSFADGSGIPVPAGSTVTVWADSNVRWLTLTGYHF